jgi:hypothetical protein
MPGSGVTIADTAGTEYELASMSASASAGSFHGQTAFTPGVPSDAGALRIAYADGALVQADLHP